MNSLRQLIFSLVVFLLLGRPALLQAEEEAVPPENEYFVDRRHKVEFIEDISKQTYINEISFDDRYVLDLYLLDQNLKNQYFQLNGEYMRTCPRAIFKSLGLSGFNNPTLRTDNVIICPNMKANCCTNNDFIGIDAIWKDYSTYFELNYDYFAYYARTTLKKLPAIVARADELRNSTAHMICRGLADVFAKFIAEDLNLDKFLTQIAKLKEYDMSIKKGFRCMLCDWNNNQFIDLQNKVVHYKSEFCVDIVKNTLPFYINMRDFFVRFYNSAAMLAKCTKHHGQEYEEIFPFEIDEALDFLEMRASYYDSECLKAFLSKDDDKIAIYCQNYCHKFDMWNFQGILPDVVKMGRMFKMIQDNLLQPEDITVVKPKDDLVVYNFPFQSPTENIFMEFEQMFGEAGAHPQNVIEED